MTYGKTIELFLVNGAAESLITAGLSNWNDNPMIEDESGELLTKPV